MADALLMAIGDEYSMVSIIPYSANAVSQDIVESA
jgi:hypothetical protein